VRRLISATGAGLAAAALAILFGLAGPAHAQDGSGPGSGPDDGTSDTTASTVFAGATDDGLPPTGIETWVLVSGAGAALASAAGARRLLRSRI
jgi:hypothetical protein